jgi:hypothetical protein
MDYEIRAIREIRGSFAFQKVNGVGLHPLLAYFPPPADGEEERPEIFAAAAIVLGHPQTAGRQVRRWRRNPFDASDLHRAAACGWSR